MSKKINKLTIIMSTLLLLTTFLPSGYGEVIGKNADDKKAGSMQITISEDNMYVRYSYDDDYDLVTHWELRSNSQTQNNSSRPAHTYKALKSSSLENAVDSENEIQSWQDSESPINLADYTWWAIFANHGYVIPAVTSAKHGKTKDDYQSVWVDQDNREYTLIGISGKNLYFAPNITFGQDNKNTRSWDYNETPSITALTHVSGAVHTDTITVSSSKTKKLYPLTKTFGEHKLTLDGQEISENGTYYGDCLEITETLACYDPATIPFTNLYPTIDLSGAEVMCYMTNNFTVIEGSITYKNSLDVRRPIYLGDTGGWGSNQAIHPAEQGTYNAYTFFPRSKKQDSPDIREKAIKIRLNSTWLKNIRKPVDRVVTYLYDPGQDDYKFGFASGLSLISGDSVDAKRVITVGSNQVCLSWSASLNKGYFQIINGSHYENGVLPAGSYFEVVSYFVHWNPDKNPGQQVYWYKDGDSWVVYAHCQTKMQDAQINLPDYMEGLTATVIDKTAGAELLSSVVTDGHLDCKFISAGTTFLKNYLVIELTKK